MYALILCVCGVYVRCVGVRIRVCVVCVLVSVYAPSELPGHYGILLEGVRGQ